MLSPGYLAASRRVWVVQFGRTRLSFGVVRRLPVGAPTMLLLAQVLLSVQIQDSAPHRLSVSRDSAYIIPELFLTMRLTDPLPAVALCTVALLSGCAPALERNSPPPAVAGVRIQVWSQDLVREKGQVVYAKNYGDTPLLITLVHLYNCENVAAPCGATQPNLQIAPGEIAVLATVKPRSTLVPFRYQYNYQWKEALTPAP